MTARGTLRAGHTCLESDHELKSVHAWEARGLAEVDGVLCNVRRCVWCHREQHKPYGSGGKKPWKVTALAPPTGAEGEAVMALGEWTTNAEMIADVARLGYIAGRVLDTTYGSAGGFWKAYRPDDLTAHDLKKLDGVDFRNLPHPDASFDTVVIDPPYKLTGTAATPGMDERYGTDVRRSQDALYTLVRDGITECVRVLAPGGHLLVKCQDMVASGRVQWQTRTFTEHAESLGCELVDSFLFRSYRPQPDGRRQVHARRNYSTLLVLRRVA